MTLSDDEIGLIRENVENQLAELSDDEIRELQERSWVSEKQFLVYVLSESGMTQSEIAEELGYDTPGTVSQYKNRVRNKFEKSDKSLEIRGYFEE